MKILVIQQKKIGDVLTSTILLEALREKYPKAELHYLVNKNTLQVLENNPDIDELVVITEKVKHSFTKFFNLIRSIRSENYDIIIDVYAKLGSGLVSYFSGAETRISYYKFYTSVFYSTTILRHDKPEHECSLAIEHRLSLLKPLGIEFKPRFPKLYLKPDEVKQAKNRLLRNSIDLAKPLIMANILGSLPEKTYPYKYMASLLDFCVEILPECQLLFNYIPEQKNEAKAVYSATSQHTKNHISFGIYGENLREFMALTAHCNLAFGNEGGGINMVKALKIPTFSIFSPFVPKNEWYGKNEKPLHRGVHISDFMDLSNIAKNQLKNNQKLYYTKLKPHLIEPKLRSFLETAFS